MNARLVLVPLLGVALVAGAWVALTPPDTAVSSPASVASVAPRAPPSRLPTEADEEVPRPPVARPGPIEPPDHAAIRAAGREAMMDGIQDQLDALEAEVGLEPAQRDALEAVMTDERTRSFDTLDLVRGPPTPGQPPPDRDAVNDKMQAAKMQAEIDARAVLDDRQYAAWLEIRKPAPRR